MEKWFSSSLSQLQISFFLFGYLDDDDARAKDCYVI